MLIEDKTYYLSDSDVSKFLLDNVNMEALIKPSDLICEFKSEELLKPCDFSIDETDMKMEDKSCDSCESNTMNKEDLNKSCDLSKDVDIEVNTSSNLHNLPFLF